VTGAQLLSAQQESVYSQYMIQPFMNSSRHHQAEASTAEQLQEAYARSGVDHNKPKAKKLQIYAPTTHIAARKAESKPKDQTKKLRMPHEIAGKLHEKLETTKTLHAKHIEDIDQMLTEIKLLRLEAMDAEQKAPLAAAKYRLYQEIKCYLTDLTECLDEKLPKIVGLEQRLMALMAKHRSTLVERRRQDVRDQAKEMADALSKLNCDRNHFKCLKYVICVVGENILHKWTTQLNEGFLEVFL
jgi:GC-rich sequence DNA-binding factor